LKPQRAIRLLACALALAAIASGTAARAADADEVVRMPLDALEQSRGRADAPITVVEFTDYQCPYCRRFQAQTWPRLKRDYVDTGKVRFIVRDLPLQFHSDARPAAAAAHCAGEQGGFWPMHEALLASDMKLDRDSLLKQAHALRLDVSRFRACLGDNKYAAAIARNTAQATALGLHGTPSFIIGKVAHGELAGERLSGALPYQDFADAINWWLTQR
jgi:protein-disulfide isomerase